MSSSDWRKVVKNPGEIKMFDALADTDFTWRTLPALIRESGMKEADVITALWKWRDFIIEGRTQAGEPVWALRRRYWQQGGFPQIMQMMSHTTTSSG
jgi:hypothetical protein